MKYRKEIACYNTERTPACRTGGSVVCFLLRLGQIQCAVGLVGCLDGREGVPVGIAVLSDRGIDTDIFKVAMVEIGKGDCPGVPVPYFDFVYAVL